MIVTCEGLISALFAGEEGTCPLNASKLCTALKCAQFLDDKPENSHPNFLTVNCDTLLFLPPPGLPLLPMA